MRQSSRANGSAKALASGLGWLSIGLGLAEMMVPRMLTEQLGMQGKEGLLRLYGARETAAGLGILATNKPSGWIWGRFAGDLLDLATMAGGLNGHNPRKSNLAMAFAAVAGVTALDGICPQALGGGPPGKLARDYSDRRGMPKPPEAMRGAGRNLSIPKDMRTPEALRPFAEPPRI